MVKDKTIRVGNSKSLTIYIRRIVIYSTFLITIIVAAIVGSHEFLVYKEISEQQKMSYIDDHKGFIKDLVDIEIESMSAQKAMFDERTTQDVKQSVDNANNIAEKIYETYHGRFSDEEIKKIIIDAIASLRFGNPYLHVFINGLDGDGVFYFDRPDYSGENLLGLTDVNGTQVVKCEVDFLKNNDEGYVRYGPENKLVKGAVPKNKIVYVKKFEPYNWYFGAKTYLEDYYEEFKGEVAKRISTNHFQFGGYVFVNEIGGKPIVMDGEVYHGDFNLLDGTDPARMSVFQQETAMVDSVPGGGYLSFRWNKMGSEEKVLMISYVGMFSEYNWIVGAGFFVDDVLGKVEVQQSQLRHGLIRNMVFIFIALLIVILIESVVIYRFNSNYVNDFQYFPRFFKEGKKRYRTIDLDTLYFDEFQQMGTVANEMIVEREKIHKQLIQEQEKATEADRLKSAFLANMSHEIRTPMNAIIGFSSLLDDSDVKEKEKKIYVKLVQRNGEFLLKLINDIIDISKIESDQLSIVKEEFALDELLDETLWNYQEILAAHSGDKVGFSLKSNLPAGFRCTTDRLRLKQVLDNLLGNAVKFTHVGEIALVVDLKGAWIHFHVKDTGIGIAEEDLRTIFNRFIQAKSLSNKTYGGTGLGLAISQKIIHLMGGDIGVKSELGKGSDFYFYIPT